eukprot:5782080-Pyramimonas_sp.AAC.1
MAHEATTSAPALLLDTRTRASRPQRSERDLYIHFLSRSAEDSRREARCVEEMPGTTGASEFRRARPCRCGVDSAASSGDGEGPFLDLWVKQAACARPALGAAVGN